MSASLSAFVSDKLFGPVYHRFPVSISIDVEYCNNGHRSNPFSTLCRTWPGLINKFVWPRIRGYSDIFRYLWHLEVSNLCAHQPTSISVERSNHFLISSHKQLQRCVSKNWFCVLIRSSSCTAWALNRPPNQHFEETWRNQLSNDS